MSTSFIKVTNCPDASSISISSINDVDSKLQDSVITNFVESACRAGKIDANKLSALLFPHTKDTGRKRIFISHLHKDKNIAYALKKHFQSTYDVFVDESVWTHVGLILERLQHRLARPLPNNKIILSDCNMVAAHMYLMLSTALLKEINSCEYFIYLIPKSNNPEMQTSPWVYYELSVAEGLRQQQIANFSKSSSINLIMETKMLAADFEYDCSKLIKNWTACSYEDLIR